MMSTKRDNCEQYIPRSLNSCVRIHGMDDIIAGVDEAGRGSVIGPLVIAGVSIEREKEQQLRSLGVKDSKELSPKKREDLAVKIQAIAKDVVVLSISACRIDNMRKDGVNLNQIEFMKMGEILNLLTPTTAYVDSPDVKPERLVALLQKMITSPTKVVAEHKADSTYPVVSAASIIAKVQRDKEIADLHKEWGDFGPGYSSNEKTMAWMRAWIEKNKEWPDIVRKSWETARELKKDKHQKGVGGFLARFQKEECKPKPFEKDTGQS